MGAISTSPDMDPFAEKGIATAFCYMPSQGAEAE